MRCEWKANRGAGSRRLRSEKGANMIEVALLSVLLFVFLFGIIDWGYIFWQHQTILWRASDAARWAVTHSVDPTAIQNLVLCGDPACSATAAGIYQGASITAARVPVAETIRGVALTRYHVQVTVSGYQIRSFTPFFGQNYTGRPIVVTQPMECQYSNCAILEPPFPP
jgi:hypothetical protein